MPLITINGKRIEALPHQTILEAAKQHGITIPTLCYHPDLSIAGSCRLCLVEQSGVDHLVPSCHEPVSEGMVVQTESDRVVQERRSVLRLLRQNGVGDNAGQTENEFMKWVRHYHVDESKAELPGLPRYVPGSDPHPFIKVDLNQCILCTRCIRACNEVQGRFVWHLAERGHEMHLVAGIGTAMQEARCESCGACAAYCPTGALSDRAATNAPASDRVVTTTCAYCGVGCQFDIHVAQEKITHIASNPDAPVNGMALCVKGRYGYDFVHHPDRLARPRVRSYLLQGTPFQQRPAGRGEWVDVSWDVALQIVASKLVTIQQQSTGQAIGFLTSAKCTNEENYLLQKLARQLLGTNNVDHCARLCHASTVAGLTMAVGSGAMSNSMDDIARHASAVFLIGSNVTEQHPVFGARLRQAVLRRQMPLIVADPRKIEIAEFAALHLRHRPGTDVALINGIMQEILRNDWQAKQFIAEKCEGFEALRETLERYTPEFVSAITEVSAQDIALAAKMLAENHPAAVVWAMGITQHTTGVMNVLSLANLQMLLGNIGISGGGVNPLRGQNNVQGACDMGALPNVFPGYQSVADPAIRQKFQSAWALGASRETAAFSISGAPGLTVTEMVSAAGSQGLRALFIVGENPAITDPNSNEVRRSLESAEFVVLQEIFSSETAEYADVILPGASFAEKDGTFTNTDRLVQLVRKAVASPGEARADWAITAELGQRILKARSMTTVGPWAGWDYAHPAQVMAEIAGVTPSYAGISHARLERGDSLAWPVPTADHPGTPILHVGKMTRGKGKFHAIEHLSAKELPDAEYPFLLTTGRVLYHWHAGEMTRRVPGLLSTYPESLLEIHPEDAHRLGIADGDLIRATSRRGVMVAHALVTERVAAGVVFGNFHFPAQQNVNNLTISATDPTAKIPEYKVCAVRVELAHLPTAKP